MNTKLIFLVIGNLKKLIFKFFNYQLHISDA